MTDKKRATKAQEPQETQGQRKMSRYIDDLIRNKTFLHDLKRLKKAIVKTGIFTEGPYDSWSKEEQKRHDAINTEIGAILTEYERLRKRCNKLFHDKPFKIHQKIADTYDLDIELLASAQSRAKKYDDNFLHFAFETDVCRIEPLHDDNLIPANNGEEIIHIKPHEQIHLRVYPAGISIHRKATKRDVLDFIEKRWSWIEPLLRLADEKILIARQRKHSREISDFLWKNRTIKPKQLKKLLDVSFPSNGLAYYEINKIIYEERRRRIGKIA